jgi:hypothetical protein
MEEVKKQREKTRSSQPRNSKAKLFSENQENSEPSIASTLPSVEPSVSVDSAETTEPKSDADVPDKDPVTTDQPVAPHPSSYEDDYEKMVDQNADLQLENKLYLMID